MQTTPVTLPFWLWINLFLQIAVMLRIWFLASCHTKLHHFVVLFTYTPLAGRYPNTTLGGVTSSHSLPMSVDHPQCCSLWNKLTSDDTHVRNILELDTYAHMQINTILSSTQACHGLWVYTTNRSLSLFFYKVSFVRLKFSIQPVIVIPNIDSMQQEICTYDSTRDSS